MEYDKALSGRIAIVTGASRERGIGTAICRSLACEGADIFFTHWAPFDATTLGGSNEAWPAILEHELRALGVRVGHLSLDLASSDAPEFLLDQVERILGATSILVNNAAHCEEVSYATLKEKFSIDTMP
ncbi:hypothetical protein GCM10025857_35470 [Alicyclobacillus contaminans]|nr:hypothetical protein GCM10025857_35470 [Alicyclobacillus contaminans]